MPAAALRDMAGAMPPGKKERYIGVRSGDWRLTNTVSARKPACHCRSLGCRCRLSRGGLLLHLLVALPQVEDLGVSLGVDLVHSVPGGSACLPVQVVRLHEDRVIASAPDPHISLAHQVQLNALPNVESSLLTCLRSVHVAQRSQAESIASARVNIAVDHGVLPGRRHLEGFPYLGVQLKVAYAAPELWHLKVGDWSRCRLCCS